MKPCDGLWKEIKTQIIDIVSKNIWDFQRLSNVICGSSKIPRIIIIYKYVYNLHITRFGNFFAKELHWIFVLSANVNTDDIFNNSCRFVHNSLILHMVIICIDDRLGNSKNKKIIQKHMNGCKLANRAELIRMFIIFAF